MRPSCDTCHLLRTGNMFSMLNGHILDWILLVDEEATHQQAEPDEILTFILFEESTYSTQPDIRKLEAEVREGGGGRPWVVWDQEDLVGSVISEGRVV